MTSRKPLRTEVLEDMDIARYESMTSAELDAELSRYGIDPLPTIEAVTALVRQRLEGWRRTSKRR